MHNRIKYFVTCIWTLLIGVSVPITAATHTVSKTGQSEFNSIQAAADASGPNDSILIMDSEKYEESVYIAFKHNLTILSQPTLNKKPSIFFQDKIRIGPKTCEETKDTAAINYYKNGALRIIQSSNITITGLTIDGIEPYPFGKNKIWDYLHSCQFAMQSGNIAISVTYSSNVTINNCEITNAYFGIYFSGTTSNLIDSRLTRPVIASTDAIVLTGNHLVSNNKIHHNMFGIGFENDNDAGTVVHNNLFYNNCYANDSIAQFVKLLTSEGANLPSGALFFKNLQKTPLAIYNNTFHNNYLIFAAHWRAANHYLIFNNIYGKPHHYWSNDTTFPNPILASDQIFTNRMFNCLYSCQSDSVRYVDEIIFYYDAVKGSWVPIDTIRRYSPRIMSGLGDVEARNVKLSYGSFDTTISSIKSRGNLIIGKNNIEAFPASANIRWLEPVFQSTEPSNPKFLIPDWSDTLMKTLAINKGWEAAGVRDGDGSIADIGAISSNPGTKGIIRILPAAILSVKFLEAIAFYLSSDVKLTNCQVEYCKFINYNTNDTITFGSSNKILPTESIYDVTISGTIANGLNILPCKIAGTMNALQYGHFELVISGINDQGIRVSSTPGFIPVNSVFSQSQLDVAFNVIDTSISETEANGKIVIQVKGKPGSSKIVYRNLSLQQLDGSRVQNIRGKAIYLDSLVIPQSEISSTITTLYTDTFTFKHKASVSIYPFIFKAGITSDTSTFTYSTHMVKLTLPTSIRGRVMAATFNDMVSRPEFADIFNLTGKKVASIPYRNYLNGFLPTTISRGMYVVKFLLADKTEIKKAGIAKIIIH